RGWGLLTLRRSGLMRGLHALPIVPAGGYLAHLGRPRVANLLEGACRLHPLPVVLALPELLRQISHPPGLQNQPGATPRLRDALLLLLLLHSLCALAGGATGGCPDALLPLQAQAGRLPPSRGASASTAGSRSGCL
ncbi:unnamed protein product, partial [Symbiodinium sp. CCMP2456]